MTTGRITVERGANSVTLTLAQWATGRTATLSYAEAKHLVEKIDDALVAMDCPDPREHSPPEGEPPKAS